MRRLLLSLLLATSAAQAADSVTLVFGGDVMLDEGPGKVIADGGDPLAPLGKLLSRSDFRIANLEAPISSKGKPNPNKIYTFRAAPNAAKLLRNRFTAVSLANNHSGDYGHPALLETMSLLDEAGVRHFGAGRNLAEAHAPLWLEKNGLKIAVLGYNEYKPRSFEAGPTWPGIAWSEDSQVLGDIRAAKAAGADLVIPFMHWGWENEPAPSARQREFAQQMIDAGAAAVVGGHPHVTQGTDIYKGAPIIYSLGNLVFDGFDTKAGRTGWLLRMTLDKQGVADWIIDEVRIDSTGTPHPSPDKRMPCAKRGDKAVRQCSQK